MANYFFDSYAVIEIVKGSQNYSVFSEEEVIITLFNLAEIYWAVLNAFNQEKADVVFERYRQSVVELEDETLKEAIKFRLQYKKRDISYADAIGYIYAKRHKIKFLTGDKEFQHLENVEFVK